MDTGSLYRLPPAGIKMEGEKDSADIHFGKDVKKIRHSGWGTERGKYSITATIWERIFRRI